MDLEGDEVNDCGLGKGIVKGCTVLRAKKKAWKLGQGAF